MAPGFIAAAGGKRKLGGPGQQGWLVRQACERRGRCFVGRIDIALGLQNETLGMAQRRAVRCRLQTAAHQIPRVGKTQLGQRNQRFKRLCLIAVFTLQKLVCGGEIAAGQRSSRFCNGSICISRDQGWRVVKGPRHPAERINHDGLIDVRRRRFDRFAAIRADRDLLTRDERGAALEDNLTLIDAQHETSLAAINLD